jgi:hypothetical protein
MNIIDVLVEPTLMESQKLQFIISAIDSRILTRDIHRRVTSSCKFWQLKLNILCLVDINYFNNEIYNYLINDSIQPLPLPENVSYECNNISELFLNTILLKKTNFYEVIYNNNPINDVLLPISTFSDLPLVDLAYRYGNSQLFSLCIYPELQERGTICHFFTLIKKDEKYYIPQYTTEIDNNEFNIFSNAISNLNDENNKEIFKDFFQKFFLKGGLQKRLISSDPDDWSTEERQKMNEYLPIEAGKNAEINFYFNPVFNYSFKVGLIQNYKSELINYIETMFIKTERTTTTQSKRIGRKYHPYLRLNTTQSGGRKKQIKTKKNKTFKKMITLKKNKKHIKTKKNKTLKKMITLKKNKKYITRKTMR